MSRNAFLFEWEGGHPALNFINTLDERMSASPLERLVDYSALVSFACQASLLGREPAAFLAKRNRETAAAVIWRNAISFREAAFRVIRALLAQRHPEPEDLDALNSTIAQTAAHRRLTVTKREVTLIWNVPDHLELPLWEIASSVEDLLLRSPLKKIRRWCSMLNCGNRSKVKRFRARGRRAE